MPRYTREEANRRHRFRMRIEQWLLLATRCALVGAAGLAFSGPSVESTVLKGTGPVGGGPTPLGGEGPAEARGYTLLPSPAAYEEAHYLPLAYPHIEGFTARSEWILGDDEEEAWALYHGSFRGKDALIKLLMRSAHGQSIGRFREK